MLVRTTLKTAKNDLKLVFVFVLERKIYETRSVISFIHVYMCLTNDIGVKHVHKVDVDCFLCSFKTKIEIEK